MVRRLEISPNQEMKGRCVIIGLRRDGELWKRRTSWVSEY